VYKDVPAVPTQNVGPVRAWCDRDDSKERCLRELEDQVCLLGGDVLWQVEGPAMEGDRQFWHGRAARQKP
jgi:hypothetical protein